MKRNSVLIGLVFLIVPLFALGVNIVRAEYPERGIRLIVSGSPGGASDMVARTLAKYANPSLGNRIYIENIEGGGHVIASREAAKSAPDGYTLMLMASTLMIAPLVTKGSPSYDLFDPICILTLESRILSTKWDGRFKTLADLVTYAKAHPGEVTAATAGVGSLDHLTSAGFAEVIGTKFTLVPFKGGNSMVVAAVGGHVDVATSSFAAALTFVQGKKLRPLVALSEKRARVYPDVPTAKEQGYDLSIAGFNAVGVPRGTPKQVKNLLATAFKKAAEDEGYKTLLDKLGLDRVFIGPEEAVPWLKNNNEYFTRLGTKIGLKPE